MLFFEAVASGVGAVVSVVAGAESVPGRAINDCSADVNVGGVTARTAPSPPTVPVAISNARFISVPSLLCL